MDAEVNRLLKDFIPAADEVSRLQAGDDAECKLFQQIAEQGHYAGRTRPSRTRQGIYAMTADGQFLGSLNSNQPQHVAEMMRRALEIWDVSLASAADQAKTVKVPAPARPETHYPEDGLVLSVFSRDLPRDNQSTAKKSDTKIETWLDSREDWRPKAWNRDFAWFRNDEALAFIPPVMEVGQSRSIPREVISRIVRLHLVDNVRGQTPHFEESDIMLADLTSRIVSVDGEKVALEFSGATKTSSEGNWPVGGYGRQEFAGKQTRGFEAQLLGRATFNSRTKRFVEFVLVAKGDRWGGTQFNGRRDDLERNPMGVAFTLAGNLPHERVAPAYFYAYGWD